MVNTLDIPIRLASLLLMSRAQITMSEIQSLPFVNNREEADAVAQNLMGLVGPKYQIKVVSGIGQADVKLRLEVAQPPPDPPPMSTRRSGSSRRESAPKSFRKTLGGADPPPSEESRGLTQEKP